MAHEMTRSTRTLTADELEALQGPEVKAAREDLAACFQMAARLEMEEGICNHFSALVPGRSDLFLVNPYGLSFGEVTAFSLLICDFDGSVLAGEGRPEATAFYIHAQVHKHCPNATACFHTHMPWATSLTLSDEDPLLYASQSSLKFYGRVAVDTDYNGLALGPEEGVRIAKSMGDADILFMRHHGVMVTTPSIAEAWDDLYFLERAAQVQQLALSSGRKLVPVSEEIARKTAEQIREEDATSAEMHLASIKRRLKGDVAPFDV